ncbi:GtrA family protein [Fictibacillus sp. Mic-4]|uniref:GtrA family protein n=1 Tax=Fictibacillus sp. Mic-4 TaxID=3132826 RepID=UPI003CF2BDB0
MRSSFIRFLIVGVINTFVGMSMMFLLLHEGGMSYWPSTVTGHLIGACTSYLLNRSFTFKNRESMSKTVFPFMFVVSSCYIFSYYFGIHFAEWLFMSISRLPVTYREDAAILFGTILYTITNYAGQKAIVFSRKNEPVKT